MASLTNENVSPGVIMAVAKELRKLTADPPEGIKVLLNEDDVTDITADISGPDATPFQGGSYRVRLVLPSDFPNAPPKGYFLTKIFHPNIAKSGEICVNTLKRDWKADLGIGHVLQVVRCLMINPFPESALNDEAGKLFMEDYDSYFKKAQMITEVHARPTSSRSSAADSSAGGPSESADGSEREEKRQKPVESKAAEKRRLEKKKTLKRL